MPKTTFEDVYQLFLMKIQDYKQKNLFLRDEVAATYLLQSYLRSAIAKFRNCKIDIQHPNMELGEFNAELGIVEMEILTKLMVEAWLDRVILDITQMNLNLNDNDFKHYSEEKNLKEKTEARDKLREINAQMLWHYEWDNVPWNKWASGDYGI